MAYLYGASIQGIQGFIFETNKLKEIAGASNLIEWFVSEQFIKNFFNGEEKYKILRNAGGNIRLLFEDIQDLEFMVKYFPKYIMQKAYGITVSQAVVEYNANCSGKEYLDIVEELERKLIYARNKAAYPLDARFNILKQCGRTGKPLYQIEIFKDTKIEYDKGSRQKYNDAPPAHRNLLLKKMSIDKKLFNYFTKEMEHISNKKNKVAVIHADGNKMGLLLQQMKNSLLKQNKNPADIQDAYKTISKAIESATIEAVKTAYKEVFKKYEEDKNSENIPFRPIIIGGDDVTFVCNADEAIVFTNIYLKKFEELTKKNFEESVKEFGLKEFENGLTACAGIAFCNEKFPFHYAVELAEALCSEAKKISKREHSCIMFHNVQSSYFIDYQNYVENELTTKKEKYKLQFAPYYTNKAPSIDAFLNVVEKFGSDDIPKGKFRTWVGEVHKNIEYAELFMERIISVLDKEQIKILNKALYGLNDKLSLQNPFVNNATPIYDIISYLSIRGAKYE